MKLFQTLSIIITLISISANSQINSYLNKNNVDCNADAYFIGMPFDSSDMGFSLEDGERMKFNTIIAEAVSRSTKQEFTIIKPSELTKYSVCTNSPFVLARMDNFYETYEGGGERSASIKVTLLFFNSPKDKSPYKKITAKASGRHDYGHSGPCKDAIKRVARSLSDEL